MVRKKKAKAKQEEARRAAQAANMQSGISRRFIEPGDTVYIGVSSHERDGVQVDAFGLLWKNGAYPEYDEAFVSRTRDGLSEEDVALRAFIHAIRTSNPEKKLIVYSKFPRISTCITAAARTIRGCRIPESPDATTVINMIKERRGRVVGRMMTQKEDLTLGYRAAALAIDSRKRVRSAATHPLLQPSTRQTHPRNDHKLESDSDTVSFFLDPGPATMDTRETSMSTLTSDTRTTSTAPLPCLINGMHPDRFAMVSNTASSSNTDINTAQSNTHSSQRDRHFGQVSSSNTDINAAQSDIHSNQRNRHFGPVTISSMGSNSSTFTPTVQHTPSSSHLINGMHPARTAMLSRPESNDSNIASSSASSSSGPSHHAMDQTVLHNRGSQVSSNLPMRQSSTASNNDISDARRPHKRKRNSSRRPGKHERDVMRLKEDIFEDAIDREWDSDDEYEGQQRRRRIASRSTTPDNAPQQPILDNEPQQPTSDNAPQQPDADNAPQQPTAENAPQQPTSDNAPQQPVSKDKNQGWVSWIRNIFF